MKIKTSELTGAALDWAAAKAAYDDRRVETYYGGVHVENQPGSAELYGIGWFNFRASTDWAQGGPIIEREGIAARRHSGGTWYAMTSDDLGNGEGARWCQYTFRNVPRTASTSRLQRFEGPTALIAAMRCYVASKLGDEVDVPEELL